MGRILYDTATTLNGFLADDQDGLEWLFEVPGGDTPQPDQYPMDATALVMGSHTYEWVMRHEHIEAHPERWRAAFGDKPVFVFTHRELPVVDGADVSLVSGTVTELLPRLRAAAGDGDLWVMGGGELVGQFLDADALDSIRLSVAPAALPSGAPLLPRRLGADRLRLVSAHAQGQFARLVYDVVGAAPAQR